MGEVGEMWNAEKERSQNKRQSNRDYAPDRLKEEGVSFQEKNLGAHLIVTTEDGNKIDYWPGTGKFIQRKNNKSGRGIQQLINICK